MEDIIISGKTERDPLDIITDKVALKKSAGKRFSIAEAEDFVNLHNTIHMVRGELTYGELDLVPENLARIRDEARHAERVPTDHERSELLKKLKIQAAQADHKSRYNVVDKIATDNMVPVYHWLSGEVTVCDAPSDHGPADRTLSFREEAQLGIQWDCVPSNPSPIEKWT